MKRFLAIAALIAAVCAVWLGTPHAIAGPSPAESRRAVIIIAPYLTWSDVTPTQTPTMWRLATQGAVGDVNARSRAREQGEPPSPLEGALTISAGAWAVPSYEAAAAYNVDESYEVGTAAEAYRRTTGEQVGDNRIVFLGLPMTERVNELRSFDVVLGTLGSAVTDAGGLTAAIGNSDVGYVTGEQRRVRPAALAAMDAQGLVALGDVSPRLVQEDPNAPFGIATDLNRFGRALDEVDKVTTKHDGPSLIVLDAGDGYRAKKFEAQVTPSIAEGQKQRALATLDEVVKLASERFGDDMVMVVSQSTGDPRSGTKEGLGPIIVSAPGWEGLVTSASTHRDGLVTNLDVTATVLQTLGIDQPVQVLGNPMTLVSGPPTVESRVAALMRMDATAIALDTAKPYVINTFVGFMVAVLVVAAFVLVRARHWSFVAVRWWVRVLRWMLLLLLAVPVSTWLMFVVSRWPATPGAAVWAFVAAVVVVWAGALALSAFAPFRIPVAAVSLLTMLVILVDQWMGAPFSFTNFSGYSPLLAARFYGLGNEGAALMFGSALVGVSLLFDTWPDSRWTRIGTRWGLALIGVMTIVTSSAPFWGANVGVAIWGVVGFVLAWFLMNGHHVSWKMVFVTLVVVALLIGVFSAFDLMAGNAQTHLGRALTSAQKGGVGELAAIVARKAQTNLRVLTKTNWAYVLVAVLAFLGFMRWRPQGDFADTLGANPYFSDAITVCLTAGAVAYFTEDSGIVIPAMIFLFLGIGIVWLMLARLVETGAAVPVHGDGSASADSPQENAQ